ncbi:MULTISPECIES: hypothetical protein [Nocardia]|uniref:Uncharacterized protein n=1 Tax=Nocardia nova TaxID=37330 RepID=A0A2T2YRB8_9NOCA|nr:MULTISPECIES: hypothetical protein [Nocardia]PSR58053.1 hypothetical protein C8259_32100 [Nocardia nova]
MDRDLAEQMLAAEEAAGDNTADEPVRPTPEGYTIDTYLLLSVIDALQGVQAAVIASAGGEPPRITPMPRPMSALDIIRDEARDRSIQKLIDQFTSSVEQFSKSGSTSSEVVDAETQ